MPSALPSPSIFFQGWPGLLRVVIIGTLAYAALILLLRLSGKRTLSKMNAFDLVVTVSLGSTLATILLSRDVALVEGIVAFSVLIGLQFGVAWLSVRSSHVHRLVKAEPTLLFYRGEFLRKAMKQQRVSESEVLAAVRAQGIAALAAVEAVVLEPDGSVVAVHRPADGHEATSLDGAQGRG